MMELNSEVKTMGVNHFQISHKVEGLELLWTQLSSKWTEDTLRSQEQGTPPPTQETQLVTLLQTQVQDLYRRTEALHGQLAGQQLCQRTADLEEKVEELSAQALREFPHLYQMCQEAMQEGEAAGARIDAVLQQVSHFEKDIAPHLQVASGQKSYLKGVEKRLGTKAEQLAVDVQALSTQVQWIQEKVVKMWQNFFCHLKPGWIPV